MDGTGFPAIGGPAGRTGRAGTRLIQNWLMPALGFGLLSGFVLLYLLDPAIYTRVIGQWSFIMTVQPFVDTQYISAQIVCWEHGIDVYVRNPCDLLGRLHDYSPLWLRLSFLGWTYTWPKLLGIVQDLAFIMALGFLPRAAGRAARLAIILCIASPTVIFALERSNNDLAMVVLAVVGLACLERSGALRFAGYAVFLLAGLLKFYPLVLFARALDERPRAFWALAAAASAAVAAFAAVYAHEIRLAIGNVPIPSNFGDGFSSAQFGNGVAFLVGVPGAGPVLRIACAVLACVAAWRIAGAAGFGAAFAALDARAASCLVAGALLFSGCFISGPSVGYRGVLLVLALPGLLAMAQAAEAAEARGTRRMLWRSVVAMILAMWNFVPMMALGAKAPLGKLLGPLPFLAIWAARELLWWLVFCIMLAVIVRFAMGSQMVRWLLMGGGFGRAGSAPPPLLPAAKG